MKLLIRHKVIIVLAIIFLVAGFLRFYRLANNPPSPTWDEVAWGYNAYSLGIDARDEFGKLLPITYLESFGDYKPPMYAYLTILPVKIFGLNVFATRFTSAFFGTLTVLLTFFLIRQILYHQDERKKNIIALLTAGLLAISPWHILLSRAAFEANVGSFFIVLAVYLFFVSIHQKKWLIVFSVLSFVASMYTFNTERVLAPFMLLVLLLIYAQKLYKTMKVQVVTAGIIGAIVFFPLFLFLLTPQAKLRFQEVNIFSDSSVVITANQEIANDHNATWSKVLHNRRFGYTVDFLKHYFDNFNPAFLFIHGDGNPKFSTQSTGEMYIWVIPFIIGGAFLIFRKREEKHWWYPVFWMLLAVVPAATAQQTPHALRIEEALPMPQFFTAYGLYYMVDALKGKIASVAYKKIAVTVVAVLALGNFLYFYHDYFTFYPRTYSGVWQYGYKDAILYAEKVQNKYQKVIMTEGLGRPYIYVLFYEKYPPTLYRRQANITRDTFGFVHVHGFGKYEFATTAEGLINPKVHALYIDTPNDIPKGARIKKVFYDLNATPALIAYTMN